MGIEPTPSAWKAEVLPLNYTRKLYRLWWRGQDSNLRRLSRQIYSLLPLTAWVPLQNGSRVLWNTNNTVSNDTFCHNFVTEDADIRR